MKIGITGRQRGMSPHQKGQLEEILVAMKVTALHHGDCVGADADQENVPETSPPPSEG